MTNIRRAILAIITAVVATLGFSVGLASAHTPNQTVTCQGWSVTLVSYEGGTNNNTITITVDGVPTSSNFGGSFSASGSWDQYADHTFKYVIDANKVQGNATQYDKTYGPVSQAHCKNNPPKPEVKVTYSDWVGGTPECGQGTVVQTRTKTTTDWVLVDHQWVAGTPVVTTETRTVEVQITPCPTTPPTTVPPTTVPPTTVPPTTVPPTTVPPTTVPPTTVPPTTAPPTTQPPAVCVYDTNLPADSPLCVPPTIPTTVPPTAPPTTVTPPVLPATGSHAGGLLIALILVAAGSIAALVARRPKHA